MEPRTVAKVAAVSFAAGSVSTYILLYQWHQRTLKFIGVAYKLAHDEIEELKGQTGEE